MFTFSGLIGQKVNCDIQLDEKIDLSNFQAKSIELHEHFNIFHFYSELRRCELISEIDYRVMHDANLLDKIRNNIFDNSIDSIASYEELLLEFNSEMKSEEFQNKKEIIITRDKLLSEFIQLPIDLNNWKTDSLTLIRLGIDEVDLPLWREHILEEDLEGELYEYFFESK